MSVIQTEMGEGLGQAVLEGPVEEVALRLARSTSVFQLLFLGEHRPARPHLSMWMKSRGALSSPDSQVTLMEFNFNCRF